MEKTDNKPFRQGINDLLDPNEPSEISEAAEKEKEKENERFTKHSPFVTLLIMSIGPLSQLIQALGEAVDMFLVSKRFGGDSNSHAVEIIGFATTIMLTITYVGNYFGQAIVAKGTTLLGSGQRDVCAHLVVDIFRIAFIFSILFAVGFSFAIKPFLKFVGCPENMINPTFKFIMLVIFFLPLITWFSCSISFLQAIGNSSIAAATKVLAVVGQCGVFSPIFLFLFKVPTSFIKLSMCISSTILCVTVMALMFVGKFSLKPSFKLFIGPFCKETGSALLLAAPMILQFLCFALPPTLILQCLTSVAPNYSEEIGGVFAVFTKIFLLATSIPGAIASGYLSVCTHAFGSNNMKRLVQTMIWAFVISFSLYFIFSPILICFPTKIAGIFLSDHLELQIAKMILPIPFYTAPLQGICIVCQMTYVIVGKPILALIPSIFQLLIQSIGCKLLAKKYSTDLIKVMYIYNISDVIVFIINMVLMIWPIIIIRKRSKTGQNLSTPSMATFMSITNIEESAYNQAA